MESSLQNKVWSKPKMRCSRKMRRFRNARCPVGPVVGKTVDGLPVDDLKRQEQLLKRMTLPEAKACIRNWLDYDRMFFVVVGDAASQLDRIRKSGLGEVKVVDLPGITLRFCNY